MHTPHPKTMARILREALAERDLTISHSCALELVARQLGHADWNVLAAQLGTGPENATPAQPSPPTGRLPDGWSTHGRSDLFRHDLQPDSGPNGIAALLIESRAPLEAVPVANPGDFLTIMQRFSALPHRGQRISFRALISCVNATGTGRLWIHARNAGRDALAFENLGLEPGPNGPITATTEWTRRSVTIEVPPDAQYIGLGVLFGSGTGTFRAADLSFGPAEPDEQPRPLPDIPRNLDLVASS